MNIDIEVVLNKAFGGFELSQKAKELYCKRKNIQIFKYTWQKVDGKDVYRKWKDGDSCNRYFYSLNNEEQVKSNNFEVFSFEDINRSDSVLVQIVKELKDEASAKYSKLVVENISLSYFIQNNDGYETIEKY